MSPPKELRYCPLCGAPLVRRHADGRERLVCSRCSEILYQNPLPAATALVLDARGDLLLGKRAVAPARGEWCLPGGFIELGESMEEAAVRELAEETGLQGRVRSFVGCCYQTSRTYGGVIIFGYRVEVTAGQARAADDMDAVAYFPLDALPPVAFESHRTLIESLRRELDSEAVTL